MVILRPTQKLRRALPVTDTDPRESDTALGDWYVNRLVVDRRPLLLLVSSKGFFPLIVPARYVSSLPARLPDLLAAALRRLSIPEELVTAECNAMHSVVVAPTCDRTVLGVMVDCAKTIPYHLEPGQWNEDSLPMVEYRLLQTPWFSTKRAEKVLFPAQAVPELLAARWSLHGDLGAGISRGETAVAHDRVVSHEEAKKRFHRWQKDGSE